MMKGPSDYTLDFERPVRDLERQIDELQEAQKGQGIDISSEIKALQQKVIDLSHEIYSNLGPWERVLLSRHPNRPHAIDYIENVFEDFHELAGDRYFANDRAVICGLAKLQSERVAVIAIEKGRKTKEKVEHNFGMPRPEGYRKALRIMKLAQLYQIPVIALVDTPGAYPGIGAEERGQSSAIAVNLEEMFGIETPMISLVIGEGGSGGALGMAITDRVFMMEYSIYSVISPESCASILWADPKKAEMAANALNLGPQQALKLGVIDGIIDEPSGGAHRDDSATYEKVRGSLAKSVIELKQTSKEQLLEERFLKFRRMGNQTIESIDANEKLLYPSAIKESK